MLPRRNRLSTAVFNEVLEHGRSVRAPHFSLRFRRIDGDDRRFGVAVGKKVARHATDRSRLRRRVYSALESHLSLVPFGVHGIIFPKQGSGDLSPSEINSEVHALLKKL